MIPEFAYPDLEETAAALRLLIRPGLAAAEILPDSALLRLPIVQARTTNYQDSAASTLIFQQVLPAVCINRLQGRDALVAPIVFGLHKFSGLPLRERYHLAATTYNQHWTWESFRKDPLTRLLRATALALLREAELTPNLGREQSVLTAATGLVGNDWVMEEFDASYIFPTEPGQPFEVLQRRRLRALRPGVKQWRNYFVWRERGVSAPPHLTLHGPGRVSIPDAYADSAGLHTYIVQIDLPAELALGETIEFTLHKLMPVVFDQFIPPDGLDWFGLLLLPAPVDSARIQLQFTGHHPQAVWRNEGIISGLLRPGQPSPQSQLEVDQFGKVQYTWHKLAVGISYGLSVDWGKP